jgi:hypothetical protein
MVEMCKNCQGSSFTIFLKNAIAENGHNKRRVIMKKASIKGAII